MKEQDYFKKMILDNMVNDALVKARASHATHAAFEVGLYLASARLGCSEHGIALAKEARHPQAAEVNAYRRGCDEHDERAA